MSSLSYQQAPANRCSSSSIAKADGMVEMFCGAWLEFMTRATPVLQPVLLS